MITTSEVALSLTIDDNRNLDKILSELREFSLVEIDKNQTIVCIVGSFGQDKTGISAKIFESLATVPLRMISYGGSNHNISVLINGEHKNAALNVLNEGLFQTELVK
ncbi:MAG TPA: ACT domain-containing protein, partial [Cytophagaceae bacterium]|nr:ACT domain-containing protein [Cytophagaceae bacterium]